nr:PPOX class F420-dependent oxidoreductase [Streptomyces sp. SID685]
MEGTPVLRGSRARIGPTPRSEGGGGAPGPFLGYRFASTPTNRPPENPVSVSLGKDVVALLRGPSTCYIATTMPDGSPQLTQTWVDTDGEHVLINSVESHQKTRNIARDPRVAVAVADPSDPTSYIQIRGRVLRVTTEGAVDHIEALSQKYLGKPYPWFGGRDQVRVIYVIRPERISSPRG